MSGTAGPDPRDGPGGLIVMVRDDPDVAARALARDLHADLAIGGRATEAALDRLTPRQPDDAELERLSAAMRRAEAVQTRTRDQQAARLARTLNTEMAIHPDTIRRAADDLLAASAATARARAGQLGDGGRTRRLVRTVAAAALIGAGVAIGAVATPFVGAAVVLVAGAAWLVAHRADVAAVRATVPDLEALEALARRRWEQVAGRGADPRNVDDVVHRYDPQHGVVADLVSLHPAVRAADRAARAHRMAWVRAWRQVIGDDADQPGPALRAIIDRETTEFWLDGTAELPLDATTLVIASPYRDLSEARAEELHRRLLTLPAHQRVIVVLAPSAPPPAGIIDLTEPDGATAPSVIDLEAREGAVDPRT